MTLIQSVIPRDPSTDVPLAQRVRISLHQITIQIVTNAHRIKIVPSVRYRATRVTGVRSMKSVTSLGVGGGVHTASIVSIMIGVRGWNRRGFLEVIAMAMVGAAVLAFGPFLLLCLLVWFVVAVRAFVL